MDSSFFHIFYLRGGDSSTPSTIYLRVTIRGKRAAASVNRKISSEFWNSSAGRAVGNSPKAKILNRYLSKVENDLLQFIRNFWKKAVLSQLKI